MTRPSSLYTQHILEASSIDPERRFHDIEENLRCYGIRVVNNRRPEDIIAKHKTISATGGDYCSAMGSENQTIFDPHAVTETSVFISMLMEGEQIISGRDRSVSTRVKPGSLFIHQRSDFYHYHALGVKQLYVIPATVTGVPVFNGKINTPVVVVDQHPLAGFIKSHMQLLDNGSQYLSQRETGTVVDGLMNMGQLLLSDIAQAKGLQASGKRAWLFNSANSMIQNNFASHDFNPDMLSAMMKCSRASLDRAFQEQKTSVMAVIRDCRLTAARELLETHPGMRIEIISWKCGFVSLSRFGKLFREKYQVTPKIWRDNYNTHSGISTGNSE